MAEIGEAEVVAGVEDWSGFSINLPIDREDGRWRWVCWDPLPGTAMPHLTAMVLVAMMAFASELDAVGTLSPGQLGSMRIAEVLTS